MTEQIIGMAKAWGMKAVRLYEPIGFKKKGVQNRYAENTGWIDLYLYELALEEKA